MKQVRTNSTAVNPDPREQQAPFAPFRDRNFVLLWLGQLISCLGDAALLLAVPVTIYNTTQSKGALSLVTIAGAVPSLLLGLFAGVFVDRWDRRRTMIVSDLARAVAVLMMLGAGGDPRRTWLIYAATFLIAAFSCFFSPARQAMMKTMLPQQQLLQGNAIINSGMQITTLVGPILAGVLLHSLGAAGVFAFDAFTFVISAVCLLLLRVPASGRPQVARGVEGVWRDMMAGLRYVQGSRLLRGIFGLLIVWVVGGEVYNTLEYAFVKDVLHRPEQFSVLMAAFGGGVIAGGLIVSGPIRSVEPRRLLPASLGVFALGGLGLAYAPNLYAAGVALFVLGLGNMLSSLPLLTLLQTATTNEMMGRVSATTGVITRTAMLTAGALAAGLATLMPLHLLFAGLAGVYLFCALLSRPLLDPARPQGDNPPASATPPVSRPVASLDS